MNAATTTGIILMFISLLIITIPGLVVNNLAANGLVPTSQTQTCSTDPNQPTCVLNTAVGCQANPAYCNLSGSSISFLNKASPFTQLAQGNIFGFFTGLTNNGTGVQGGRGPFDALGGVFLNGECEVFQNVDGHQTNAAINKCTQTNLDNSNMTQANTATWNNWNVLQTGLPAKSLQFYHLSNASFAMTCSWDAQINYTALANGPGWTYFGCDVSQGALSISGSRIWSLLVAMPVSTGGIPPGMHHWNLFFMLMHSDFDSGNGPSLSSTGFFNNQYNNWIFSFKGILISGSPFSSQYFVPGINGPMLAWLAGIVLFIIGLGLNFAINGTFFGTGGGVSAGVNRQGTKLAQVLGIGLMIYAPFYSEFSSWFTTGYFPYGLDGATGGISIAIAALFFGGVLWWATQN